MNLEAEAAAALAQNKGNTDATPAQDEGEEVGPENAFVALAHSAIAIEKHLFALVYLYKTSRPEVTGVTFVHDVFDAIYDGSDPFKEIDDVMKALKAKEKAEGKDVQAP